jgi:hypothetical protein
MRGPSPLERYLHFVPAGLRRKGLMSLRCCLRRISSVQASHFKGRAGWILHRSNSLAGRVYPSFAA